MGNLDLKIAEKIVITRRRLAETQKTFGERFNVKKLTVNKWESGESVPDREHATQLTKLFQDVLGEEDDSKVEIDNVQRLLPFDEPVNLEFRLSPVSADKIRLNLEIKRKVG
jgi:DNA-binding XRE family transcriptional regulator